MKKQKKEQDNTPHAPGRGSDKQHPETPVLQPKMPAKQEPHKPGSD